ncbi:MAG: RNA methyltransferase [Burkholderiales bacterium]|nr:RNA methyltransferase [Burkholderiales bacterium]
MKIITSADNPHFKTLSRLLQSSRERRKAGLSLLDGVHLIQTYCENVGEPERIAVSATGLKSFEILNIINKLENIHPLVFSDALFGHLSTVATPTGILAAVRVPRERLIPADPGPCLLLDDIQDPGNLGSILRSAAASGLREIYLSAHSVHSWSPRVLRAGMGAHFLLDIHEGADLAAVIRKFRGRVIATSHRAARTIFDADLTGKIALLLGNEGAGVSRALLEAADEVVAIPMPGKTESLNAAAAAAVCLFERVRQQRMRRGVERRQ